MAKRTPVPELPKSSGMRGECRPFTPTPLMCHFPSLDFSSTGTQCGHGLGCVDHVFGLQQGPSTTVSPLATAPNISERWDMDLSPGTRMVPLRPEALREIKGWGVSECDILLSFKEVVLSGSFPTRMLGACHAPKNRVLTFMSDVACTAHFPF